jgi:cyclopropane fatty-acyl-phospholipid synthase-like methyltransferase
MPDWWEGFFEGLWQDAQLGLWTEEDNRATADKIERAMGLRQPARIIDVPCGDGRISLELAARGHDVTGVDLTERFLAEAERKVGGTGPVGPLGAPGHARSVVRVGVRSRSELRR